MHTEPFVIERVYNAPVQKVWHAITDRDAMEKWYFNLAQFRPEVGFEFSFTGGPEDGIQYVHLCKITEVEPEKKLTYSWRYKGYEGNSYVTFELFAEDDKTRVKLTHTGLESFPANSPDFARKSFEAGWTYIVSTSLENFLTQ